MCRYVRVWENAVVRPDEPSPEDYVTSTNPGRFEAVIASTRTLIADLESTYVVTIDHGDWPSDFPQFTSTDDWEDPIRVTPTSGTAVVFGFTPHPGVVVRYGPDVSGAYPDCGCDACDLQPDEVFEDLRLHVDAVVNGRFSERIGRRSHQYSFAVPGVWQGGSSRKLKRGEPRLLGPRGHHRYEAWLRR